MSVGKIMPNIHFGGSVACVGFSLLYMMGFDKIILVGQDLAFTNKRSHADGTFEEKMPERDTSNMICVKGNYEDEVPTRSDFKLYLEWFEDYIEQIKKRRKVEVINATEGGAYIKGTQIVSLKEAIEENYGEYIDFEKRIGELPCGFSEDDKVKVAKFILQLPKDFKRIENDIVELIEVYKKIEQLVKRKKINSEKYVKCLKNVKKYTKKIEGNTVYQLIQNTLSYAEWIVRSESLLEVDDIEKEAKMIAGQGLKFTKLMLECTRILSECADEMEQKLRDRHFDICQKADLGE